VSNPSEARDGQIQRKELFISYSHHDEPWLKKLRIHLKPLESLYRLERWDDSLIQPGDKWLNEIQTALARAQVALLLVSPEFLASDFIQRKELPELLRYADEDGLKVLWLPLSPSSWKLFPHIEQYQAIISPAKSLAQMSKVDQDLAMVEITEKIHRIFTELQAEQHTNPKAVQEERARDLQEEEIHRAEQEAQSQRAEEARLEKKITADGVVRAEAERWPAEAERLTREKEEWQRKAEAVAQAPQPAAQAASPAEAVRFKNQNSDKYMAVPESKKNPGVEIIQWQGTGGDDQLWWIDRTQQGYFTIQNVNSGLYLAVNQNSKNCGTRVCQWGRTEEEGQLWKLELMSTGAYKIRSVRSGLLLAVGQGSKDNGAFLCQWDDLSINPSIPGQGGQIGIAEQLWIKES